MSLGLRMEEMIFNLADTHLFFNDLEVSSNPTYSIFIPSVYLLPPLSLSLPTPFIYLRTLGALLTLTSMTKGLKTRKEETQLI